MTVPPLRRDDVLRLTQMGAVVPEGHNLLYFEHLLRYRFARDQAPARGVAVDLGCGQGYGTALLRERVRRAIGGDLFADSLSFARARYPGPGLDYLRFDARRIPLGAGCVDLVVCFEAIEHVTAPERLVREAARGLRPGGVFLVSTPYLEHAAEGRPENPLHEKEYTADEFRELLRPSFGEVELLGQTREAEAVAVEGGWKKIRALDPFGLRRFLPRGWITRTARGIARMSGRTAPTEERLEAFTRIIPDTRPGIRYMIAVGKKPGAKVQELGTRN